MQEILEFEQVYKQYDEYLKNKDKNKFYIKLLIPSILLIISSLFGLGIWLGSDRIARISYLVTTIIGYFVSIIVYFIINKQIKTNHLNTKEMFYNRFKEKYEFINDAFDVSFIYTKIKNIFQMNDQENIKRLLGMTSYKDIFKPTYYDLFSDLWVTKTDVKLFKFSEYEWRINKFNGFCILFICILGILGVIMMLLPAMFINSPIISRF